MPITRVICGEHLTDAEREIISEVLHDCLVTEFAVPPDDKFQIFEQLSDHRRIANPHYLSKGRSAGFILFQITAGKPRSSEQKQRFYRALSDGLKAKAGISPEDVMVTLQFNQAEDWSFSKGEKFGL
jgi:phenylpyruvate tautomerase PptA (4-oxalocrotonate tautomerase family)